MSFYYSPTPSETYESFQRRDEEIERSNERRYQARREMNLDDETHCRDANDYDEANWSPVVLIEAGLMTDEASAFVRMLERKPVVVKRMQMNLFPTEVA
jgi:hypothetical protein